MEQIRLQKYLADNGIASRRKCEELIAQGLVKVNGKIISELGTKINPETDKVEYKDKIIEKIKKKLVYILLNKPIGYVTTAKEQFNRPIVMDLVKDINIRLVPVGRLDMYTSGALILTNDGDFVYKATHPKFEVEKTYIVTLKGQVLEEEMERLRNGVEIEHCISGKAKVKLIRYDEEKNISRLAITIHEGKNREVRKMCEAIDKKVLALHRTKIGNIEVKPLKIGEWRYLSEKEVSAIVR